MGVFCGIIIRIQEHFSFYIHLRITFHFFMLSRSSMLFRHTLSRHTTLSNAAKYGQSMRHNRERPQSLRFLIAPRAQDSCKLDILAPKIERSRPYLKQILKGIQSRNNDPFSVTSQRPTLCNHILTARQQGFSCAQLECSADRTSHRALNVQQNRLRASEHSAHRVGGKLSK